MIRSFSFEPTKFHDGAFDSVKGILSAGRKVRSEIELRFIAGCVGFKPGRETPHFVEEGFALWVASKHLRHHGLQHKNAAREAARLVGRYKHSVRSLASLVESFGLCTLPFSIDHINGVKSDNRISNLRDVPHDENQRNRCAPKCNSSGVVGVCRDKETGKWQSYISRDGERFNLGRFNDSDAAVAARKSAERLYGFHENHGRLNEEAA